MEWIIRLRIIPFGCTPQHDCWCMGEGVMFKDWLCSCLFCLQGIVLIGFGNVMRSMSSVITHTSSWFFPGNKIDGGSSTHHECRLATSSDILHFTTWIPLAVVSFASPDTRSIASNDKHQHFRVQRLCISPPFRSLGEHLSLFYTKTSWLKGFILGQVHKSEYFWIILSSTMLRY